MSCKRDLFLGPDVHSRQTERHVSTRIKEHVSPKELQRREIIKWREHRVDTNTTNILVRERKKFSQDSIEK